MSLEFTPGRPLRAYDTKGMFRDFSTDELVGRKLNFFHQWLCGAGKENIHINMDGDVFGASCKVGGKLGNVFEDFQVPENWVECSKPICSCGADLFIPKSKTISEKSLLRKTFGMSIINKKVEKIDTIAALERTHASNFRQVYWEIGRRCNYDCSYCWPWIHNKTDRHKTFEELLKATRLVEKRFICGKLVNFIISGGEPTVNPALMDWVRYIQGFGHHVSIHSNGSRTPDYYRELIHYTDLNLSLHFEYWNPERFFAVIEAVTAEKVKNRNKGVGHFELKVMMTPGKRQETLQIEERLKKIPLFTDHCTWAVVPVRDRKTGGHVMADYEAADYELFGDRR